MLCVQESVLESVVARLKQRMGQLKCVGLRSDGDRVLVDTAVQEAQQQGATVGQKHPHSGRHTDNDFILVLSNFHKQVFP